MVLKCRLPGGDIASSTLVADGKWHHCVVTMAAVKQEFRLYVDGMHEATAVLTARPSPANFAVKIGYTTPDFPRRSFFGGQISDVKYWTRGLKEDEVRAIAVESGTVAPLFTCSQLTAGKYQNPTDLHNRSNRVAQGQHQARAQCKQHCSATASSMEAAALLRNA